MTTVACIYHWYVSAMFVVPVLGVGGWAWWSSRKAASAAGRAGHEHRSEGLARN